VRGTAGHLPACLPRWADRCGAALVVEEFGRIAVEFLRNGVNPKVFQSAASASARPQAPRGSSGRARGLAGPYEAGFGCGVRREAGGPDGFHRQRRPSHHVPALGMLQAGRACSLSLSLTHTPQHLSLSLNHPLLSLNPSLSLNNTPPLSLS
jgi:hypothetical protein